MDAGGALTITVAKRKANHQHALDLTAQEMLDIKAGKMVMKPSGTNEARNHTVIFN